jgi:hypothetical protein
VTWGINKSKVFCAANDKKKIKTKANHKNWRVHAKVCLEDGIAF